MTTFDHNQTFVTHEPHPVGMIGFDDALLLDIAGPLQVFSTANRIVRNGAYDIRLFSLQGRSVETDTGLSLETLRLPDILPSGGTLLVPGGPGVDIQCRDKMFIDRLKAVSTNQARIVSVCSGSLLLAEAGLLKNRSATCHWERTPILETRYPNVLWDPDVLHTKDRNVYTSAGVTAGIDLALVLIEEDLGAAAALSVARELVVHLRRPGGQSQFSAPLTAQYDGPSSVQKLCAAIVANPARTWRVSQMAEIACTTERTLARHFARLTGLSPARFVETARLDAARGMLETSGRSLGAIAMASGFTDAQTLRRAFRRHLGLAPAEYRRRFSTI